MPWADAHSVRDDANADFKLVSDAHNVRIRFAVPESVLNVNGPLTSHEFIGKLPHTQQGLADPDANPITVDRDYHGNPLRRPHPLPGPFATLQPGVNEFALWDSRR